MLETSLLVTLGIDTFITKPIIPLIDESILLLSIDLSVQRFTGRLKSGRFNSFKQGFIECLCMGQALPLMIGAQDELEFLPTRKSRSVARLPF